MSWAWVRPADAAILSGRPLLDLGAGDGQTARALGLDGSIVAVDRSSAALALAPDRNNVAADAEALPLRDATFQVVLAADLFHHLDDGALCRTLDEALRVLSSSGRLVAWWYSAPGRPGPDSPRFPRRAHDVVELATRAGFARAAEIELIASIDPIPATGAITAQRP